LESELCAIHPEISRILSGTSWNFGLKDRRLEQHAERHLNLPRAANRLHDLPEARGTEIETVGRVGRIATRRQSWCGADSVRRLDHRERTKSQIVIKIVDRYVKAWMVGQVVNIEAVLQRYPPP
jgi:hypothetical protein